MGSGNRLIGVLLWLAWLGLLVLWTIGLLIPDPSAATRVHLSAEAHFTVSKLCHLLIYATLTATLVWLPCGSGWRWGLLVLLLLHGCGSEFLQLFIEGRHGSLRDVLLDHGGVCMGWLTWRAKALVSFPFPGPLEPAPRRHRQRWVGEPTTARAEDQPQAG